MCSVSVLAEHTPADVGTAAAAADGARVVHAPCQAFNALQQAVCQLLGVRSGSTMSTLQSRRALLCTARCTNDSLAGLQAIWQVLGTMPWIKPRTPTV